MSHIKGEDFIERYHNACKNEYYSASYKE